MHTISTIAADNPSTLVARVMSTTPVGTLSSTPSNACPRATAARGPAAPTSPTRSPCRRRMSATTWRRPPPRSSVATAARNGTPTSSAMTMPIIRVPPHRMTRPRRDRGLRRPRPRKLRKISSTIAKPSPISAAAIVMTNSVRTCPERRASCSQTSKATRLRLTALSMSSTDMRTRIALRRARTP